MPAVFVHGNPETAVIWAPLLEHLGRNDVICLSPPGFGAPTPEGWGATAGEYAAWLAAELGALGGPVDLVGHDWGGGHVLAVAVTRPDLLRSWASDILGAAHPAYVWHDMAQVWQTPDAGEQAIAEMLAAGPEARAQRFGSFGVPPAQAAELAAAFDAEMGRCILALYRSAAQPALAELGSALPAAAARPGLALVATADPFVGTEEMHREMAQRAGARVALLPGRGHWWMLEDPKSGAEALRDFWAVLPA